MALATATLKTISARFSIDNCNTSLEGLLMFDRSGVGASVDYTDRFIPLERNKDVSALAQ